MENRLAVLAVASIVGLAACTTAGPSPATAPPTTPPPATSTTATTTSKPPAVVSSTTTVDRRAEIEAIFRDVERRRLQAILDQDREAFLAAFSNAGYAQESIPLMKVTVVLDPSAVLFRVVETYVDSPDCIAVGAVVDMTLATEGGSTSVKIDYVVQQTDEEWGLSWVGGGWRCDGPHPFSG